MFNRELFIEDVSYAGGLQAVSLKADINLQTLEAWHSGTRVPRFISLGGIAAALGYLPERYFI